MSDMDCPYCDAGQEVCYDDGHGCCEGEFYEHECSECGKNFVFTTGIILHHEPSPAPCLNGEPHNYKPVVHAPRHWPDWVRCEWCGHEVRGRSVEPEKREIA